MPVLTLFLIPSTSFQSLLIHYDDGSFLIPAFSPFFCVQPSIGKDVFLTGRYGTQD